MISEKLLFGLKKLCVCLLKYSVFFFRINPLALTEIMVYIVKQITGMSISTLMKKWLAAAAIDDDALFQMWKQQLDLLRK